ncbi:MAG: asparagine synthase (glutamine-hydrolyzing) [Chitinophagaceae bacterium]|nr:asparagine synthase (glutamine-hydrolyzing) [Chitinophagaceae bacterium]
MCGIVGSIGFKVKDGADVLSCIAHRGPDSQGSFAEDNVFLGHTRLSIQDLSENGNQPMFSSDGRYVIVFNGEIYNHLDVRAKLEGEFSFRSTGDTETVLNAYRKFGPACLNMLNGIFALAIYDRHTKNLFIARDQMGVKPLYIYREGEKLLFSSEIKSFLKFSIDKSLDPCALVNYMTFLWAPGELTPFLKVRKLLPGHYITTNATGRFTDTVKYYQLSFNGRYLNHTDEQLIDLLEEKLISAVKRQMLSDVPVGFFLSGGLDSSLIVAIAKKLYPEARFPCFTIDVGGWDKGKEGFTDDLEYARKVATLLNVDLHVVKADIDIVRDFDKMIWHLDEPQADAAPLNVLNIADLARMQGIKVLLGGTGGDDLFSGYRRHQALAYERYFNAVPPFVGKLLAYLASKMPAHHPTLRRIRRVMRSLGKTTDGRMADFFTWLSVDTVKSLFSPEWQNKLTGYSPVSELMKLNADIPEEKSRLNQMLYWEMKTFLVDHNLNYTDKMAMAVGVEARVPFLDLELVEFSTSLPPQLKLRNGETKYILKKVAERYLPKDIIYRPKTGFGAPVREWITGDMQDLIKQRLSPEHIGKAGVFNYDKVQQLIRENISGKVDASYSIWAILAIDSWINQYTKNNHHG